MKKILMMIYLLSMISFGVYNQKVIQAEGLASTNISTAIDDNYSATLQQWQKEGLRDDILFEGVISPSVFVLNSSMHGSLTSVTEGYQSFLDKNNLTNGSLIRFLSLIKHLQKINMWHLKLTLMKRAFIP